MKYFRNLLLAFCCLGIFFPPPACAAKPTGAQRAASPSKGKSASARKKQNVRSLPVVQAAKPFFSDDMDRASIIAAYRMNLRYLESRSSGVSIRLGHNVISRKHALRTLKHLIALFESDMDMLSISRVINEKYMVYKFKKRGLVTGYFSADYEVSAVKGGRYVHLLPSTKRVNGKPVPLAYAASSKALRDIRIEGSGYLVYEDGNRKLVAVTGKKPYSLKEITTCDFPSTAMDCEPVPGRTVAVDRQFVSLGLPLYLITRKPLADDDGKIVGRLGVARFVAAHDIGGAIKGEGRIDLYFGSGRKNVSEGKQMHHPGTVFLLALKPQYMKDPLPQPPSLSSK